MPDTGEDVVADEVTGVDTDESETRAVVIDKKLIAEAGNEPLRDPEAEPKEDDDGGS
jgi:hypothetical protein